MKLKQISFLLAVTFLLFTTLSVNSSTTHPDGNDYAIDDFPADNYADELITSMSFFYDSGENALGAPDGLYANMFEYYGPGVMILDFGRYEICVNDTGNDLRVHVNNGTYRVKIGNSLATPFTALGEANTTADFDIDSVGFTEVRYVQILYHSGGHVELDAIEAINLYTVGIDNVDPNVTPIDDFVIFDNVSFISFEWDVSDDTPWNYSIKVNGENFEEEEWIETTISFLWLEITAQNLTVTLTLLDFYGNSAQDVVEIEIRADPTRTSFYLIFFVPIGIYYIYRRKRNYS